MAIRRAAWREGAATGWHDDLVWYAAAVHQMKLLTPGLGEYQALLLELLQDGAPGPLRSQMAEIARGWSDPRSLGYQSQVHGTFVAADHWPSHDGHRAVWHQCAHNHWFFLPWHRAYLLEFELVARELIRELGGPDSWGLPYWNYSDYLNRPRPVSCRWRCAARCCPMAWRYPASSPTAKAGC